MQLNVRGKRSFEGKFTQNYCSLLIDNIKCLIALSVFIAGLTHSADAGMAHYCKPNSQPQFTSEI